VAEVALPFLFLPVFAGFSGVPHSTQDAAATGFVADGASVVVMVNVCAD